MSVKVLHVIGSLGLGGAQIVLKHLVESTDHTQIETFVYPLRSRDIRIPIQGCIIIRPYRNYDPRKFFTILDLCKKHDIDILVGHLDKAVIGCLLASFFCKARVIVYEHGSVVVPGLLYSLYRLVLKVLWKRADLFIAVSKNMADYLVLKIGVSPDKVTVVYNPVQSDVFDYQRFSSIAARENLGISHNDIVIGFVGTLDPVKGPDILVKAVSLLIQKRSNYLLIIAGEGPQRVSLERLTHKLDIASRVRFLGFRQDIPEIMTAFDIGVVPSRYESFGIVCLELMRMKIPVVSSGAGGMTEYITNEQTGLLLKQNTPEEITACVERLVNDRQLRFGIVERAYKLTDQFSIDKVVEEFQRICFNGISRRDKTKH
jgi:glycosyltransferase involved in cell wall biosynthesis